MTDNFQKILILSPHTDDAEHGAGGSIARWQEEGKELFYVAWSIAEKSVPAGLPKNILQTEVKKATRVLGIKSDHLFIYKFEVRIFPQLRQEILELMVKLKRKIAPDLILIPCVNDIHQDHSTVAAEGIRAFKHCNIVSYELEQNMLSFSPSFFVSLNEAHIRKKIQAVKCYESQRHRKYTDDEYIRGLARVRGIQVNCKYAEAFEVVRWIMK